MVWGFFIDVQIQLSPFSHHHFPTPTSHLQPHPSLAPSMGPSFMFIYVPFPSFLCYYGFNLHSPSD